MALKDIHIDTNSISRSRSRNGCITCRIRRVKCDEERPHCRRCRSTGRKCDGYVPPNKHQELEQAKRVPSQMQMHIIQHTPQVTIPTRMWMLPAVDRLLTEDEYRSLEFFYVHTVSCFGGQAGGCLLNAACQDAGIRLAAMALGTMHCLVLRHDKMPSHIRRRDMQLALQQYNSAIRRGLSQFPRSKDDRSAGIDGILSMCVLFFCFESLQGHFRAALRHVTAGLRILAERQTLTGGKAKNMLLPPEVVQSLFAALESQILEIDGHSPLSDDYGLLVRGWLQQPLWTLEEANDAFRHIYNNFLRLLSFSSKGDEPHNGVAIVPFTEQILAWYCQVQADLHAWSWHFDHFLANIFNLDNADNASQQLVLMLQLWRCMLDVILRMGCPPPETTCDGYLCEFTTILDLAEEIIIMSPTSEAPFSIPPSGKSRGSPSGFNTSSDEGMSSPSHQTFPSRHIPSTTGYTTILPRPFYSKPSRFSMSLGILPALWTIATQCRDSKIRYRAIDLIGRSNRREGVWDSALYSRLARQIAGHEEQAAGLAVGTVYTPSSIPPEVRVTIDGKLEEGRRARVAYLRGGRKVGEEAFQW
ncbi:hypothetical protein BDW75DRAFT_186443 [Aspergillus navahoensis]